MIHGSSCEANLPLIAALPDPIAADLELKCYEKIYSAASSPKSGCVLSTINHYLRRLIQKNCRQIIRTGKDVQVYRQGRLSRISQSVCSTINIYLQTQHTIHFKCLRQTTAKTFPASALVCVSRHGTNRLSPNEV